MRSRALVHAGIILVAGYAAALAGDAPNLIANGDFERRLDGWKDWSNPPASVTVLQGLGKDASFGARLLAGPDPQSPATLATQRTPLDGNEAYELTVAARAEGRPAVLTVRFTPKNSKDEPVQGKASWHSWTVEAGAWQTLRCVLTTPAEVGKGGLCHFTFFCRLDAVLLDNAHLKRCEDRLSLRFRDQTIPPGLPPPRPWTTIEGHGDILFFRRPEPGEFRGLRSDEPPSEADIVDRVATFCARGAPASVWFGVLAQRDLPNPRIEFSDLLRDDGVAVPADRLRLSRVLRWPRRVSPSTMTYRVMSEVLQRLDLRSGRSPIPATAYDTAVWNWGVGGESRLAAGAFEQFLLMLADTDRLEAGVYRGRLTVSADAAAPATLGFQVTVLDFPILRPDPARRHWSIDADTQRYAEWPVERILAELAVLKSAGIEGLKCKGAWRQVKKDGEWTDVEVAGLRQTLEAMKQVSMAGPVFISNQQLPANLGPWFGQRLDPRDTSTWTTEFEDALRKALGMMDAQVRSYGLDWFLYPADEIYGTDRAMPATNILRALRRVAPGIPVCVTCDIEFTRKAVDDCIHRRMYNPRFCAYTEQIHQEAVAEARRVGQPFEWYGSGAYADQIGNVSSNRYAAGALFWKTAAVGHHSWTLQRPSGSPWNDFDGDADRAVMYPPKFDDGPFTETLQWHGLREGILDAWYLHTLEQALERAEQSPAAAARALAEATRAEYRRKLHSVPWLRDWYTACLTADRLESLRWWAALTTTRLLTAAQGLQERPAASVAPRPDAVEVRFLHEPPAAPTPAFAGLNHPVVTIPRLAREPRIDGDLDDFASGLTPLACADAAGRGDPATRVYVGHTEDKFWLLAVCDEPAMARLKEQTTGGKGKVWRDDSIEVMLDTTFDQRSFYQFVVSSAGSAVAFRLQRDADGATASYEMPLDAWRCQTRKDAAQWRLEMLIPLQAMDATPGLWGFGLSRNRWASGREEHITYPARAWLFHRPDLFAPAVFDGGVGRLTRLEMPKPSLGANRLAMTFQGLRADGPGHEVVAGGGCQARIESQAGDAEATTVTLRYDLPRPGRYETGLRIAGEDGRPARVYRVRPAVDRVLDPPDTFLRLYRPSDGAARFPFRLDVRADSLADFRLEWTLITGGLTRATLEPSPASPSFVVLVHPDRLPAGEHRLRLRLLRQADAEEVFSTETPFEVLPDSP